MSDSVDERSYDIGHARGFREGAAKALSARAEHVVFTWGDVDRLRSVADNVVAGDGWGVYWTDGFLETLDLLAARIAALLPPREG